MLKILLLLVVTTLVTGTWSSPAQGHHQALRHNLQRLPRAWPCPEEGPSEPCRCNADDAELTLDLDCSAATSNQELEQYFQKPFPLTAFRRLTILPPTPPAALDTLTPLMFGPVSFQEVEISNTNIDVLEELALVSSHPTLVTLDLRDNLINSFPNLALNDYEVLEEVDLSDNQLDGLFYLSSGSLKVLRLSGNFGVNMYDSDLSGCTVLEELYLDNTNLTGYYEDLFVDFKFIRIIDLGYNELTGVLPENAINPPSYAILDTVILRDNALDNIHHLAITNLDRNATVDLQSNNIQFLEREDWEDLLSQVDGPDAIDLRDNPLVCLCDMYWIVVDPETMAKIHRDTTCSTGEYLHDLDVGWYETYCPAP